MQYRPFGKDGWKVSALGFGAMRLPGNAAGNGVDVDLSVRLIRHGIDKGINYVDTAYFYHDGQSEGIVAQALRDGYRERVRIATKSPGHLITTVDDFDRILEEQLQRLETECIDYYLFHGIGAKGLEQIRALHLFDRIERARADGKIGHIGFSFHDNNDAFKSIVDSYDGWEFCQIQFNYMDITNQAGLAGLQYAAARGIPVIVMEPLLGGRLTKPPKEAADLFSATALSWTAAAWSLRWIWNHPEVATILSGMNSFEQLDENLATAEDALPGSLTAEQCATIDAARAALMKRTVIPCTGCRYCMPCPQGVEIPWNLEQYNAGGIYDDWGAPRFVYSVFMNETQRASACIGCGECDSRCPQKIPVSEWMPKIAKVLG